MVDLQLVAKLLIDLREEVLYGDGDDDNFADVDVVGVGVEIVTYVMYAGLRRITADSRP